MEVQASFTGQCDTKHYGDRKKSVTNKSGPSGVGRAEHWAVECVAEWLGGHPDTRVNDTTRGGVMMMAMMDERPGVCLAHCEKKCSVLA